MISISLTDDEVRLIVEAFGTVSGGWNLTPAEQALVEKLEAARA